MSPPVIDAHHHLWELTSSTVWPAPEDGPLYRDFDLAELEPQLDDAEVDRTVLVQTEDSDADTDFLLAAAASSSRVAGVVGWLPLDRPSRAETRLGVLEAAPKFVGVRCLIHRIGDDDWLVRPDVDDGLTMLERHGVPFDVVADQPAQLHHVAGIAARHPDLPLVIDHLAKPPIGAGDDSAWRAELVRAAGPSNVHAKLSGLYPRVGDRRDWTAQTLRPYVELALELFGADRLMLGSDWPVCVTAGGYQRVWSALHHLIDELSPAECAAIRGDTATRFYRLTS